ncbi:hypothetical protein B484DRAFT_398576, partial [Ochromonadaceae sp. CCMP2298]
MPGMLRRLLLLLLAVLLCAHCWRVPTPTDPITRFRADVQRSIVGVGALGALLLPTVPTAAGAEVLREALERGDVEFPVQLRGDWDTVRKITLVEGDAGAAAAVWRGLGGTGDFRALTENYVTRF